MNGLFNVQRDSHGLQIPSMHVSHDLASWLPSSQLSLLLHGSLQCVIYCQHAEFTIPRNHSHLVLLLLLLVRLHFSLLDSGMASLVSVFPSPFFLHLVLVFSSGFDKGIHENCPSSFKCGDLGTFHFPFTKPELRQDCGFITVHGCDNPKSNKTIELEKNNNGRKLWLIHYVHQNIIRVLDQDLDRLLKSKNYCRVFDSNTSLPSNSALVYFQILNYGTLKKCSHCHYVSRPTAFVKHRCAEFDVYWEGSSRRKPSSDIHAPPGSFPNCSELQLPSKYMSETDDDHLWFLTGQIDIQVRLSDDCDEPH
ncbi:uncharacterized protein LOC129322590 [Prosopis cineraria]|uniref:uncharacterized protein LOC129322590 n=1 Tax=Prosopis cineraria TaxID=364024 RepID=UPI0024106BF4|nr:uncharacterized protein LOC129322590 [Prosopis cineraria]